MTDPDSRIARIEERQKDTAHTVQALVALPVEVARLAERTDALKEDLKDFRESSEAGQQKIVDRLLQLGFAIVGSIATGVVLAILIGN